MSVFKMNKCRIYLRKSTDNYQEYSLDTQLSKIQDYCKINKYEIVKIYKDVGSGSSINHRQEFKLMMNEIKRNDTIICYSLSRLSRSIKDVINIFEELDKKNVKFISICEAIDTKSYFGKFQINLLASLSSLEIDLMKTRISEAMIRLSQDGKLIKKPPFGYKFMGKGLPQEKDEEEQKVIEIIKKLYEEDKMTFTQIGEYLDKNGIKIRKCKKAYQNIIKNILANNGVKIR